MRRAEKEFGRRNSPRGGERRRNAGGGTRPGAESGEGMPEAELDPGRRAEKECRRRSSTRGGERRGRRGATGGERKECPEAGARPRGGERKRSHRILAPRACPRTHSISAFRAGSSSASGIPSPLPATGRVPLPAFPSASPHRGEFRPRLSFSALRNGSRSRPSPLNAEALPPCPPQSDIIRMPDLA